MLQQEVGALQMTLCCCHMQRRPPALVVSVNVASLSVRERRGGGRQVTLATSNSTTSKFPALAAWCRGV